MPIVDITIKKVFPDKSKKIEVATPDSESLILTYRKSNRMIHGESYRVMITGSGVDPNYPALNLLSYSDNATIELLTSIIGKDYMVTPDHLSSLQSILTYNRLMNRSLGNHLSR